jgi:intraflagellar transport protein 56
LRDLTGRDYGGNELIRHNLVVFRNGENAMSVLPKLVDILPEARLNLVIFHLRNNDIKEAFHLVKDLKPNTPQEYILKGVVHASLGQNDGSDENLKTAQQYFQLVSFLLSHPPPLSLGYLGVLWLLMGVQVGASASECDTIPGRQCMASCFFLLKQFEDVLIYLKSIKSYFSSGGLTSGRLRLPGTPVARSEAYMSWAEVSSRRSCVLSACAVLFSSFLSCPLPDLPCTLTCVASFLLPRPRTLPDDDFNWNYGLAKASVGEFAEAEEALLAIQNETYQSDPIFQHWLTRTYIMNNKPGLAWEMYLRMENSTVGHNLLQLIANDCYKMGHFLFSAKAFDVLERLDPAPEYWEGKRGACVGVFQAIVAGKEAPDSLGDVLQMLRNTQNPQVEYIIRVMRKSAAEQGLA